MKNPNWNKTVAIIASVSLIFLQVVPASLANPTAPEDLAGGAMSTQPEVAVAEAPAPEPLPPTDSPTSTDFMQGGMSLSFSDQEASDAPVLVPSIEEIPELVECTGPECEAEINAEDLAEPALDDADGTGAGEPVQQADDGSTQYFDEEGYIIKEERPDGSAVEYLYGEVELSEGGQTQRMIVGAVFTRPDGTQVTVDLSAGQLSFPESGYGGIMGSGLAAIEASVIDLLNKNEISGGTLVLKVVEQTFGEMMCTTSIPPACTGDMYASFDLESDAAVYSYQATIPMDSYDRGREHSVWFVSKTELDKTDGSGAGEVEPIHVDWDFPPEAYESLSAEELDALMTAQGDVGPESEYSRTLWQDGSEAWTWTSADGQSSYTLKKTVIQLTQPDGTILTEEDWSFTVVSQVSVDEVAAQLDLITDPGMRAEAEAALADGDVFFKTQVPGQDPVYEWRSLSAEDPTRSVRYELSTYHVLVSIDPETYATEVSFATLENVPIEEVEAAAASLPPDQQQAVLDALAAASFVRITKTTVGGDVTYSWTSPESTTTIYAITINENGQVNYSIQMRVPQDAIVTPPIPQEPPVQVDWNFPPEAYESLSAEEIAALEVAQSDVGPDSQYTLTTWNDGSEAWTWTSADGQTTYTLKKTAIDLMQPDGTFLVEEEWSFTIVSQVPNDELLALLDLITDPEIRADAEAAIADGDVFYKNQVPGQDPVYEWRSVSSEDPVRNVRYVISMHQVILSMDPETYATEASFATLENVSIEELESYAQTLPADSQQAFLDALAALEAEGITMVTKTTVGDNVSYSWTDSEISTKMYMISVNENGQVAFSIQIRVPQDQIVAPISTEPIQEVVIFAPYLPEGVVTFPTTLKYYDADNILLREVDMSAPDQIDVVREFAPDRVTEIPVKVEVYPQGSEQPHAVLEYDAQGQLQTMTVYEGDGYAPDAGTVTPGGGINVTGGTIVSGGTFETGTITVPTGDIQLETTGQIPLSPEAIVAYNLERVMNSMGDATELMQSAGTTRPEQRETLNEVDLIVEEIDTAVQVAVNAARDIGTAEVRTIVKSWRAFKRDLRRAKRQDRTNGGYQSTISAFEQGSALFEPLLQELL